MRAANTLAAAFGGLAVEGPAYRHPGFQARHITITGLGAHTAAHVWQRQGTDPSSRPMALCGPDGPWQDGQKCAKVNEHTGRDGSVHPSALPTSTVHPEAHPTLKTSGLHGPAVPPGRLPEVRGGKE